MFLKILNLISLFGFQKNCVKMLSLANETEQTIVVNVCVTTESISEPYSVQEIALENFSSYENYFLVIKFVTDLFAVVGDVA